MDIEEALIIMIIRLVLRNFGMMYLGLENFNEKQIKSIIMNDFL